MAKRALIALKDSRLSRNVAARLESGGVRAVEHSSVLEAVNELYSNALAWIVLDLDLFPAASRPQLLAAELWALNRQSPVTLVSVEDAAALRRVFGSGPLCLEAVVSPGEAQARLLEAAARLCGAAPAAESPRRPGAATTSEPVRRADSTPPKAAAAPAAEPPRSPAFGQAASPQGVLHVDEKRRIESKLQLLDEGDHYRILDLALTATARQVKAAYFRLVKQFHPDRYYGRLDEEWNRHVTRLFRGITRAYETLIDPRSRQRYDAAYRPVAATTTAELVTEQPAAVEQEPEAEVAEEPMLTREELDEFLRREKEWVRDREHQAASRAQALFEQAAEVLGSADPASLPLAPIREAYKAVTEATSLMPEDETYFEAYQTLRDLYEKKRAYYHYRRGLERVEAGEVPAGYQDLKDAVTFDPKPEYLASMVQTMLDLGLDLPRAEILAQSLVDEEPGNALYRILYGRCLAAHGRLKDALAHLHLAAKLGMRAEAFQWIEQFERGPARR